MGIRHFSNLYRDPRAANISEILQIARSMQRFVGDEDIGNLNALSPWGNLKRC